MLTTEDYEKFKKRLDEAKRKLAEQEAKRVQIIEHLRLTYGMTPEEAGEEVERLKEVIPQQEAEFEKLYNEFTSKWEKVLNN